MADVALLVIHHLPDDPPTGDLRRMVLLGWESGICSVGLALLATPKMPIAWWAEEPVLAARPEDRLTTDDVEVVCGLALDEAENRVFGFECTGDLDTIRRLRATLGEEGTK